MKRGCTLRTWMLVPLLVGIHAIAGPAQAGESRYRVEVLVFTHSYSQAEPIEVSSVRGFHDLFRLTQDNMPEAPGVVANGDSFKNLMSRLTRLDGYHPLVMMAWEQSQFDYHPPVRVHNEEVIAEELHFPGDVVYVDMDSHDLFGAWVLPMYRLDGSVQLRRSRFLHLELDLEYRVDDPAWAEAFPAGDMPEEDSGEVDIFNVSFDDTGEPDNPPEPFQIHTLAQSRQIKTNEVHYFDSEYFGVLARVIVINTD